MTGRFIGQTYEEYRREFVEHFPYGKQIGNFLGHQNGQTRPQASKPIFLGLEAEKSEDWIPDLENFEKCIKDAANKTVQNGLYTSPNELMRFPNKAKPILVKIKKHNKNAVINQMVL